MPPYTRNELTALVHAQLDFTLTPTHFSELSPDAQLRFRVLFQQRAFTAQHPVHPYFVRRVIATTAYPIFEFLSDEAREVLEGLKTITPALTQINRLKYSLLAQRNLLVVSYP